MTDELAVPDEVALRRQERETRATVARRERETREALDLFGATPETFFGVAQWERTLRYWRDNPVLPGETW